MRDNLDKIEIYTKKFAYLYKIINVLCYDVPFFKFFLFQKVLQIDCVL